MITRLCVDNYRNLNGLDLRLGPMNLLTGVNGSGKTSVVMALDALRWLWFGSKCVDVLSAKSLTRWSESSRQSFRIEARRPGVADGDAIGATYELSVQHDIDAGKCEVVAEQIHDANGGVVFEFRDGKVRLYGEHGERTSEYPLAREATALQTLDIASVPPAVLVIVGELLGLQLLRLRPEEVLDESERRHPSMLYADGRDYVAWYRHLSEDERPLRTLHDSLREMLPGLSGLALTDLEQGRRRLVVRRSAPSEEAPDQEYRLSDLSDGERALIVLYTILADARQVGGTICVDEPDNFLALQEIQPWLTELSDLCDEGRAQAILVSHHPELLNYLGWEYGLWLSQDESGRTRVTKLSEKVPVEEDLPEIVARGWIDP